MQQKITVLGASNVDITGFTKQKLIYGDANIGYTKTSPGGVGRNIAENLQLLGFDIDLISVFGSDPLSEYIVKSCRDKSLKIDNSLFLTDENAATFLAVMDENNDLALGISAMEIFNKIGASEVSKKLKDVSKSAYFVLETNFSAEILEAVVQQSRHPKIVLDSVSGKKALRTKNILKDLYILKTNLLEAKMLAESYGKNLEKEDELALFLVDQGVTNVFITLGKEGVVYADKTGSYRHLSIPAPVVNTIGAGDSFVSGIVYADFLGHDIHKMALYGMASAHINVQYDEAVSPEMSRERIHQILQKL